MTAKYFPSPCACSSWAQTLALWMTKQTFYHCAIIVGQISLESLPPEVSRIKDMIRTNLYTFKMSRHIRDNQRSDKYAEQNMERSFSSKWDRMLTDLINKFGHRLYRYFCQNQSPSFVFSKNVSSCFNFKIIFLFDFCSF